MAHARLGPSNHRWPNCPGSVREEVNYEDTSGEAAIDGTGSHLLLELCLLSESGIWSNASDWIDRTIGEGHKDRPQGWWVKQDRADRVQVCLDYLRRRHGELTEQYPDGEVLIEAESHSDPGGAFGRKDWWGTVDITITVMVRERCMFVEACDYKDGRGWVTEKDNTQLIAYVGGKMRPFIGSGPDQVRPFKPEMVGACRMSIVQPKTHPPIRYQDSTPAGVFSDLEHLAMAAKATDAPDAPLIPDDKGGKGYCQWCKHKSNCSARTAQGAQGVAMMTTAIGTSGEGSLIEIMQAGQVSPETMSNEQIASILDALPLVKALTDQVEAEATKRAEAIPGSVPGYMMGTGRGSRVWAHDAETTEKMLKGMRLKKDQIHPSKLASPAQIEKLEQLTERQKKKLETEMITTMEGKAKLVKAKGIQTTVTDSMFAAVANPIAPATEPQPAVAPAAAVPSFL